MKHPEQIIPKVFIRHISAILKQYSVFYLFTFMNFTLINFILIKKKNVNNTNTFEYILDDIEDDFVKVWF